MPKPRPRPGLLTHLPALLSAFSEYFATRFRLLAAESKEAAVIWAIVLGLAAAALFVIILGYFFLVIAIVFAIALHFDSEIAWILITLSAAVFHLLAAAALGFLAYSRISLPLFSRTSGEFRNDALWLQTLTKTP